MFVRPSTRGCLAKLQSYLSSNSYWIPIYNRSSMGLQYVSMLSQADTVRLTVPAQPVDATPSNALIRQCLPGRTDLIDCTWYVRRSGAGLALIDELLAREQRAG